MLGLGKFYYRPPGGGLGPTSVALRVRHVLLDLAHTHADRRVWVFTHQAVIMSFRLVLEGLDEAALLDVDRNEPLGNCSLTRYRRSDGGSLELATFADARHLEASEVEATHEASAEPEQAQRQNGSRQLLASTGPAVTTAKVSCDMARNTTIPIDVELLRSWALPSQDGDKADRGTVLVVGGARQTPGAVLLAAETALRVGAGKVQVATATDTAAALAVALPEALVEGLPVLRDGELAVAGADRVVELAHGADVVLLGPGLGSPERASLFAAQIVPRLDTSVVIDALGLPS